ncbi:MAG: AAA family ATPase [Paracoccaceae bacterium]|nr:AAA family ATPase [Paracoccaceae bacterium]
MDKTASIPEDAPGLPHDPPAWIEEIRSALLYCDHLVLSGNTRDLYPAMENGGGAGFQGLEDSLWELLKAGGTKALIRYDPVDGFQLHKRCARSKRALVGAGIPIGEAPDSLGRIAEVQHAIANFSKFPVALLIDYASHLHGASEADLEDFFVSVDSNSRDRSGPDAPPKNPTFWVADHPADLPDWFVVNNNRLREVFLELPNLEDRFFFARHLGESTGCAPDLDLLAHERLLQQFALECDGEPLLGMQCIVQLAGGETLELNRLTDAVRTYRTGSRRNPWSSPVLQTRIRRAKETLEDRIKGQPRALEKTLDILARSILGLSGAQSGTGHARPRGALFFVGPTGVGKTELAKAVTELLFGDENACHRFDMSEFMDESSINRLIGAPPGHPGHERGGHLVNAARRRPFSVFLFDEIEKAHPRILDLFLQILDEGRLTDARGATAYFSEALIIFTSNIGIAKGSRVSNRGMNVLPSDTYSELASKIGHAVEEHFRIDLKRPELLNRIGQNIVVFDFLKPDGIAQIFESILGRVLTTVRIEHGSEVVLSQAAHDSLRMLCTQDYFEGGRGIANRIEAHFINPLAREMFDNGVPSRLEVAGIAEERGKTKLVLEGAAQAGSDRQEPHFVRPHRVLAEPLLRKKTWPDAPGSTSRRRRFLSEEGPIGRGDRPDRKPPLPV